jgi:hypothetical protein
MTAALYRFRSELRHGGWRFVVGVSVLLGVVGGMSLLAATGARRTASAFERLEVATRAGEVLVNPNDEELRQALPPEQLARIDGVSELAEAEGMLVVIDGRVVDAAVLTSTSSSWFRDIDVPVVREGRLPDQSRPDELFANPEGARVAGLEVGEQVDMVVISPDELTDDLLRGDDSQENIARLARTGAVGEPMSATLVGIGETTSDVVPGAALDIVYLTRAFREQHPDVLPIFGGTVVRLREGSAGVADFTDAVRALASENSSSDVAIIDFQTLDADRQTVHRAVTPQVLVLVLFTVALAIAAALATAQALGRRVGLQRDSDAVLASLGMTAGERRSIDWMRLGLVSTVGVVLAVAVAVASSPLMPLGLARQVEPAPGFAVDAVPLVVGGLLLWATVIAFGAVSTLRARQGTSASRRSSFIAGWFRSTVPSVSVSLGAGLALEPGAGRTAVPTRSTLVAATVGLAAVVAALTFAAGLTHLLDSPGNYGSNFDFNLQSDQLTESDQIATLSRLATILDDDPEVDSWSQLYTEQITLPSGVVPANGLGIEKGTAQDGTGAGPTLVRGRLPVRPDEVALGALTMRAESVDLGDQVEVRRGGVDQGSDFTVVGQVVLPGASSYGASDQAALGVGALFSVDGLATLTGGTPFSRGAPDDASPPRAILVSTAPGASGRAVQDRIAGQLSPGAFLVGGPIRSSDVASLDRIRSSPIVLALVLGLIAGVAVGHALVVSVRRRRSDLAVLRTLGLTPGQVSGAIAWQATIVVLVAAVIGVPLGMVAGRAAWGAVARQLGVVDGLVVPWVVLLVVPLAVVFANIVAFGPGWRVGRLRPAEILRAE